MVKRTKKNEMSISSTLFGLGLVGVTLYNIFNYAMNPHEGAAEYFSRNNVACASNLPREGSSRGSMRSLEGITEPRLGSIETIEPIELEPEFISDRKYQLPEEQRTEKNVLLIAAAMYLEGRGVHEEGTNIPRESYLRIIGGSVVERAVKGFRGNSVEEILGANKQYSFTNSDDPQKEISTRVKDHAKESVIDWRAYVKCEGVARDIVYNGSNSDIDHFYVKEVGSDKVPYWAKGKTPAMLTKHKSYLGGKIKTCETSGFNFL